MLIYGILVARALGACSTDDLSSLEITDSGKFINDLGDYESCQARANESHYLSTYILNTFSGSMYHGMCVPRNCTPADLNGEVNVTLAHSLN
jgi:hypothetical protein